MFLISVMMYFLCFLITWMYIYNLRIKRKNKLMPPGPPCLPVVGSLPFLGWNGQKSFKGLSDKYGPIIYLKIGRYWTVVLNNYDVVEEVSSS